MSEYPFPIGKALRQLDNDEKVFPVSRAYSQAIAESVPTSPYFAMRAKDRDGNLPFLSFDPEVAGAGGYQSENSLSMRENIASRKAGREVAVATAQIKGQGKGEDLADFEDSNKEWEYGSKLWEALSTPGYMTRGAVDEYIRTGSAVGAMTQAYSELSSLWDDNAKARKVSTQDWLKEGHILEDSPYSQAVLGFIGDLILDPTTFASGGVLAGSRVGRAIVKVGGESALKAVQQTQRALRFVDPASNVLRGTGKILGAGAKFAKNTDTGKATLDFLEDTFVSSAKLKKTEEGRKVLAHEKAAYAFSDEERLRVAQTTERIFANTLPEERIAIGLWADQGREVLEQRFKSMAAKGMVDENNIPTLMDKYDLFRSEMDTMFKREAENGVISETMFRDAYIHGAPELSKQSSRMVKRLRNELGVTAQDARDLRLGTGTAKGPTKPATSSYGKHFDSMLDRLKSGISTELDASLLYARRGFEHVRTIANAKLIDNILKDDALKDVVKMVDNPDLLKSTDALKEYEKMLAMDGRGLIKVRRNGNPIAKTDPKTGELLTGNSGEGSISMLIEAPKEIADHLNGVERMFNDNGMLGKFFKNVFDPAQSWWKSMAVLSPGYHTRNLMGNIFNAYLGGLTDPRWYHRAAQIQSGMRTMGSVADRALTRVMHPISGKPKYAPVEHAMTVGQERELRELLANRWELNRTLPGTTERDIHGVPITVQSAVKPDLYHPMVDATIETVDRMFTAIGKVSGKGPGEAFDDLIYKIKDSDPEAMNQLAQIFGWQGGPAKLAGNKFDDAVDLENWPGSIKDFPILAQAGLIRRKPRAPAIKPQDPGWKLEDFQQPKGTPEQVKSQWMAMPKAEFEQLFPKVDTSKMSPQELEAHYASLRALTQQYPGSLRRLSSEMSDEEFAYFANPVLAPGWTSKAKAAEPVAEKATPKAKKTDLKPPVKSTDVSSTATRFDNDTMIADVARAIQRQGPGARELAVKAWKLVAHDNPNELSSIHSEMLDNYANILRIDPQTGEDLKRAAKIDESLPNFGGQGYVSPEDTGDVLAQVSMEKIPLFKKSIDVFGTTDNIKEAGYVLPDGTMLDFSGKGRVAGKGWANGKELDPLPGDRYLEHSEVGRVFRDDHVSHSDRAYKDQDEFISNGAIRIDAHIGEVEAIAPITSAQIQQIMDLFYSGGPRKISVHIRSPEAIAKNKKLLGRPIEGSGARTNEEFYRSYYRDQDTPDKMIGDIRAYFNGYRGGLREFRQGIDEVKGTMRQVDPMKDTRAIIALLQGSDVSTLPHELAHVVRKHLPEADRKELNAWVNAASDDWTVAQEEQFARGFERMLHENKLDGMSPALAKTMGTMKKGMMEVYDAIDGSPLDVGISDKARQVMENVVGKGVKRLDDYIIKEITWRKGWSEEDRKLIGEVKNGEALSGEQVRKLATKYGVFDSSMWDNEFYESTWSRQARLINSRLNKDLHKSRLKSLREAAKLEMPTLPTGSINKESTAMDIATAGDATDVAIARAMAADPDPMNSLSGRAFRAIKMDPRIPKIMGGDGASTLHDVSMSIGKGVDQNAKLALFSDQLSKGVAPELASLHTKKYLGDWSELTEVEKAVFRRAIPFYSWMRFNIPMHVQAAMLEPGRYKRMMGVVSLPSRMTEDWEPSQEPDYFAEQYAQRMPMMIDGKPVYWTPSLPALDLNKMGAKDLLSSMSPLVKVPLEYATGQNFFQNRETENYPGEVPDAIKGTAWEENMPNWMVRKRMSQAVSSMLPLQDRLGRLFTKVTEGNTPVAIWNEITGQKLVPVDQQKALRQNNYARQQIIRAFKRKLKDQQKWVAKRRAMEQEDEEEE